ncbi:2'-5' RNA ligase superfamily protein [Pseudacidovorax intermedius]|uniref:2'-5' RNA ligase superfamily protein n=1 Tax=Pseudacidovorax intermedius TaxID=433924 RepID=A0A370F6G8_9BURK|nr:2'-5' RNA ligase family protein [Pseudacidovorax intermedius]RDI17768.1 2'-5' RNA ligase superfamily protein [Pseudacidovorax intermedius]
MQPTALIVTLRMDAASAAALTALRSAHFPPSRNWLDAHITLFHALPVAELPRVRQDMAEIVERTAPFKLDVDRVQFLGAGVAYAMSAPEALRLRATLATNWSGLLGAQDRQWRGPLHVTVQNKVRPDQARMLHAELARDFVPWKVGATGLDLWYYMGGPWERVGDFAFCGAGPA